MTPRRAVVAVIYAEATTPVVRSQSPPLLAALRAAGRRVDAALFTSPRALFIPSARAAHARALAAFADATGVAPMRWTHLPKDRGLETLARSLAKSLVKRGLDDAVLFCRQPRAALVGVAAKRAMKSRGGHAPRVVLDLRGIRDVEYLMTLGKSEDVLTAEEKSHLATYRAQEETACRGVDAVLCVSRAMAKLVVERHGVDAARVGRVPNHAAPVLDAEARRTTARADLGVKADALLVAYAGTLAAWQMPEASALLFQSLNALRPDARLLFLTPDEAAARDVLARAGVTDAIVRSAPPGETARLLCAADYGLLLRRDDVVNRVACPVKFGEYLACGVRPILTSHVGDLSDLARDAGLGVVVGLMKTSDAGLLVANDARHPDVLAPAGRERLRTWAQENISPERAAARIAEFLDEKLAP